MSGSIERRQAITSREFAAQRGVLIIGAGWWIGGKGASPPTPVPGSCLPTLVPCYELLGSARRAAMV